MPKELCPLAGVVPAYQPPPDFPQLLRAAMQAAHLAQIVVTDDGSGADYAGVFREVAAIPGVQIVRHAANRGTGAALKTAIRTLLISGIKICGAVTFDADGQHTPEDVGRVAEHFRNAPACTVFGVRDFHNRSITVPWRSRFGNLVMEKALQKLCSIKLSDTQTGLRVYPATLLAKLGQIEPDGYDFQLEALLTAARRTAILEVPVKTIYLDGNAASHFSPWRDSIRIGRALLRAAKSFRVRFFLGSF